MLCKAWTDSEFVYSAKGTLFDNVLYKRYVNLMKDEEYSSETNPSSRQRGCYVRTMTAMVQSGVSRGLTPRRMEVNRQL
jgi:hypothetical protein